MKQLIIMSVSALSALTLVAEGQEPRTPKTERDQSTDQRAFRARAERLNAVAKSSDLIGMEVKNYQNEKLGKVEDLGVDVESGRVVLVILSTGGFLGVGDRVTAVPPGSLHHDVANKVVHLAADKEKLKSTPQFDGSKWRESFQSEPVAAVYRHYGVPVYFIDQRDVPGAVPNRNPEGTLNRDRNLNEITSRNRLGYVEKASKLKGMAVKNLQNEKVGDVDNLTVDLAAGRVVAIIVSSGGFLGLGEELSAIPPTAFRFNSERDTLQLDVSKDALSAAPHFKANQWPDLGQPTYTEGVYRAYGVEPYFRGADNTARNARDRDDRTLTPLDQGTSAPDRERTAQIRKEVVATKGISVNAKNVKIITNNGRVTLRGPVNTAEEKRLIGEIAAQIAKAENVDNQLEVTAPEIK